MNWVDIVIVASIAWFTYAAYRAGLIREVVTIIGAVMGVVLAGLLYTELAVDVEVAVDDQQTAQVIAFVMIFGAVVLASQLIAMFLKTTASLLMLGILDSLGGAAFGFLKGIVFVEIALILAVTFETLGLQEAIDGSGIAPLFLDVLPFLEHLLPQEFETAIDNF